MSGGNGTRVGLRAMADLATPMAIRVAATLRVADHVADRPRTAGELAPAIGVDVEALERLLRHLVTVGLFCRNAAGAFTTTELGDELRDDHPAGKRKWLDASGAIGKGDLSFVELLSTVRTGKPAYPVRYGVQFWDDLAYDGALSTSFDDLMAHHVALDHNGIADAYPWSRLSHVVDVGGGTGALLAAVLDRHPTLRGTLVDLPGPAMTGQRRLDERGLAERADVVIGSFFEPLPSGGGGYVLSSILHDWPDDAATAILRRCAEAAGSTGSVLVIEAIGADGESPDTVMDLRMLAYTSGKERGLSDLRTLGARVGLSVRGVQPVGRHAFISIVDFGPTKE